jgi:hypothetical protein
MINKVSSEFASRIGRYVPYITPRAGLTTALAIGALGALLYFFQKKPQLPPITRTPLPPELRPLIPRIAAQKPSSSYASIRHSKNISFRIIAPFLPPAGAKPIQWKGGPLDLARQLQNLNPRW